MRSILVAAAACAVVGCALEEFGEGASGSASHGGTGGGGSGSVDASSTSGQGSGGSTTCSATFDFDDGVLPRALEMIEDANVSVALEDSAVVITIADTASASALGELRTIAPNDMSACSASVHAIDTRAGGSFGAQSVYLALEANRDPQQFAVLLAAAGELSAIESSIEGPMTIAASALQPFLRIRMSAGTMSWQTSPNGAEWTAIASKATPTWSTSAHVRIGAMGPGVSTFDDLILASE